jgi:4-amino-4-deoxy-L-arabinose transferase-like glycosyltransferase
MDVEQIKVKSKSNIILLIIFVVAITLRIGLNVARQGILFHAPFLMSAGQSDDRISSDATYYIYGAKGFLSGKGVASMEKAVIPYRGDTQKPIAGYIDLKEIDEKYFVHKIVPPLYTLFLALCYSIGGFNILAYFIPQLILSSLTCLLIYFLTEELFNKTAALFAGFAVAFYPDLIFWTSFARPETLFIFLLALGFLLLIKGNSRKNPFLLYLSAIVLGLASLTRITLTPFLPLICLWQARFFSKNRKESFKVALFMALIIVMVLLPWGMRNYIVFGKFNVLSDEAGILIGSIESGEQYKGVEIDKSYNSYDPLILKITVFIKNNFRVYLASCWHRFLIFWSPFTYVMRPLAKLYKGLSWLIIFPAAFWGMIISRKKWRRSGELIIMFIFYYSLLYTMSLMHLNLVYRYPIQPFLCIFAGYTFYKIYMRINKKRIE